MAEYTIKSYQEEIDTSQYTFFVMGIDLGGTYTTIGIAGVGADPPEMITSFEFETKSFDSIISPINEICSLLKKEYNITITSLCIGAAGVVDKKQNTIQLTNISWDISKKEIIEKTPLSFVYLINDFQLIGYGIQLLDHTNPDEILIIKRGETREPNNTKAIIGAGSGLGKCLLFYNSKNNTYTPLPSEGGHADISIYTAEEMELIQSIKKQQKISEPITYEHVLSGKGVERIYQYIHSTQKYQETSYTQAIDVSDEKTALISKYRTIDKTCENTFTIFTRFFARCIKNFALDTLPYGGVYIAGGIARKNKEIFQSEVFLSEVHYAYRRSKLLSEIPIYLILDNEVSPKGACFVAMQQFLDHEKEKNMKN